MVSALRLQAVNNTSGCAVWLACRPIGALIHNNPNSRLVWQLRCYLVTAALLITILERQQTLDCEGWYAPVPPAAHPSAVPGSC